MKLQTPKIKLTTLLLCAICSYAAYEAGHKVGGLEASADMQTLEQAGFTDKPQLPVFIDNGIY